MKKFYHWVALVILIVQSNIAFAQKPRIVYTPPSSSTTARGARVMSGPTIEVQGQQTGTTLKLRWVPVGDDTGLTWQKGVTDGYIIKRKLIRKNGQAVANQSFVTLATVKPAPSNSTLWNQTTTENSKTHSILKKLLYEYQADDLQPDERYPYFVWASTYSFAAAIKGGMAYTDNTVISGEIYVYTIEVVSSTVKSAEYSNADALLAIPAPAVPIITYDSKILAGSEANPKRLVRITSRIDTTRTDYIGYWIERSPNTSTYTRINSDLIVPMSESDPGSPSIANFQLSYNDTIPYNRSTYTYRIIGRTLFDENATSIVQTQTSKLPISVSPVMDSVKVFDNRTANLYWHYVNTNGVTVAQSSDIGSQFIQRSAKADAAFSKDPSPGSLSTTDRIKQISGISDNEYFRIGAIGIDGDTVFSQAMLGQYIDKSPPQIPSSVSVKWNNAKKMPVISWDSNKEPDLAGYRVYRKNSAAEEPVQITPVVYANLITPTRTTYEDTTTFRVTGMELKYFVAAEDKKGNLSGRSNSVSVVVPDLANPNPPIFVTDSVNRSKPSVYLSWRNSSSADVKKHTLYRAVLPDETFFVKLTYTNATNEYVDSEVEFGKRYLYMIMAEDTTGLSTPSPSRIVQMPNAPVQQFTAFKAQYQLSTQSILLDWQYPNPNDVASYEIYRAEGGASIPTTWSLVSAPSVSTQDASVKVGTGYKYQIRGILKSGALTSWANLEILFPNNLCVDGEARITNTTIAVASTVTKQQACEEVILGPGFEARPQASGSYEAVIKK